jgi:hypothetical protein
MDVVADKFAREKDLVDLLMQRLDLAVSRYSDPNDQPNVETGVDVVADTALGRLGIQVTEFDTGSKPGAARAAEKAASRKGEEEHGGVYGGWAQNDLSSVLKAIRRRIERKAVASTIPGFDEVWLLISCGVPEPGSVVSTFAVTTSLTTKDLDAATTALSNSKYRRVFLHSILGTEHALYHWQPNFGWTKNVQGEPTEMRGPSFWDFQRFIREFPNSKHSARLVSRRKSS